MAFYYDYNMTKTFKLLALAGLLISFVACSQKTDKEKTDATVSQQTIKDHVYYLASDEMRGRDVGSPEIQIAAQYLADKLSAYGAKPVKGADGFFQPVPLRKTAPPQAASLKMGSDTYQSSVDMLLMDGTDGEFSADVVYVNYGNEADYEGLDVTGKIVFAQGGDGKSVSPQEWLQIGREKKKLAAAKGAVALVEFYNNSTRPFGNIVGFFGRPRITIDPDGFNGQNSEPIAHIWLKDPDNVKRALVGKGTVKKATISARGVTNQLLPSKNVVAMVEGTDPELKKEFVMFSAHYDHVGVGRPVEGDSIYNGARDNAIGTVTVLTAAENIGKYPMKRSALFVLYTAEEKGLLGSRYMANNPLIPNEDIVFCWNSDNGGYNDTSIATIVGLTRTTAQPMIEEAVATYGLKAIEDPTGAEQGLFDRSDNVNFARKGIPAPTFSLGFTAFDAEIGKYYHQPRDEPESVDYDYLYKFFRGYVLASRKIGNAPEAPFWVEGDKYYETGKKLYGKD